MGGGAVESALRAGAGAPDLKLIETLGWDGQHLVRLPLHLARLARSAALLGWRCDLLVVVHLTAKDITIDGRQRFVEHGLQWSSCQFSRQGLFPRHDVQNFW